MNLILFGFKGCGKTFYGKKLSKMTERTFIDADVLLEGLFYKTAERKLTTKEIFQALGPAKYRALEHELILSMQSIQHSIIAVGSESMMHTQNIEALSKIGKLVFVDVPRELIKKRIFAEELPHYLQTENPEGSFDIFYDDTYQWFEKIPAMHLKTENKTDKQILLELEKMVM